MSGVGWVVGERDRGGEREEEREGEREREKMERRQHCRECFRKVGRCEHVGSRTIHSEIVVGRPTLLGDCGRPAVERTGESDWCNLQTDCTRVGSHLPHRGSKLVDFQAVLTKILSFRSVTIRSRLVLCGEFNRSFCGMTDYHHVGESISRPRTLTDTNDHTEIKSTAYSCSGHGSVCGEHLDGLEQRR